jgi:hypothetical protein
MTAKVRGAVRTLRPPFWKPFIGIFSSVPYCGARKNVEQVLVFEFCSCPSGKKQGNFMFSVYTINIHAVYMKLLVFYADVICSLVIFQQAGGLTISVETLNTLRTAHELTRFTPLNMADRSRVTSFLEHDKL